MARTERTFQTEFRQSLRTLPGVKFYHKIVDAGFTNPFDAVLCYNKAFLGLEYKISKSLTSIPLVNLFSNRAHELQALKRVKQAGGKEWILINIWNPHKWNYILAMDTEQYDYLVDAITPKKSIKINDPLLSNIIRIDKKDGVYDLTSLIK